MGKPNIIVVLFDDMGWGQPQCYNPESALTDKDQAVEQETQLRQALQSLDERSRDIIQRRWLNEENKPTLHELADEYGVSAERIRQIEKKALGSMKNVLVA